MPTYLNKHALKRLIWLMLVISTAPHAATTENAVKAGFIYNFSKFIEWPASTNLYTTLNVCVIGDNRLEDSLSALEGKKIGNKPIHVRLNVEAKDIKTCQLLFVATDNDNETYSILHELKHVPVVTVSDSPEFTMKGGMIGLIHDGSRVGFEVNLAPTEEAGVHLSAQLLKLAKVVRGTK